MKRVCMFCMRSHRRKPKLCQAKSDVLGAYTKRVPQRDFWKIMHAIETGLIDLDGEAARLLQRRAFQSRSKAA